jgi:IS30 family transposase
MTAEDEMTINERRKYLRKMKTRYCKATRQERGQLLDEMEAVTGLHRKSIIRLMHSSLERKTRTGQRGKTYDAEVSNAIRVISASLDHPCAERLTPNLVWLAKHLTAHDELQISDRLLLLLKQISISTVQRHLRTIGQDQPRLARKRPRPANGVLRDIPAGRIPWDVGEPGHFETDLVHHCGTSATGEYLHTLQMVDVTTGWTEPRAVLGRSYVVMEDAFQSILERVPFAVREIHPDNGSEFLNHHLVRFWKEAVKGVHLSRSRPYHKNDNPFVEQRNGHPIRTYLGYDRLDTVAHTQAVNQLYDKLWLYLNFFQPVMRVAEKTVIAVEGQRTRTKRHYDSARTPFDRACAAEAILDERRAQLTKLRDQTNPLQLLAEIRELIDHIFSLPNAVPGQAQNVYDTLEYKNDRKPNEPEVR